MRKGPTAERTRACILSIMAVTIVVSCGRSGPAFAAPPNEAARAVVDGRTIDLRYEGENLFRAEVAATEGGVEAKVNVFRTGDAVTQVILLTPRDRRAKVRLTGTLLGGAESFACESDRRDRGPVMVRHVSGTSRSLLNRAVYDRRRDWVFSVDAGPRASVKPLREEAGSREYGFEAEGGEIVLRFRPRFFQRHRGLEFFEPWTYKIWPRPVAGWISWFAFYDKVTETDIVETADTLSDVLLPFSYEYLQIDDGYQRGEGLPELWLQANAKFPRGLGFLAGYIKSKGLKPGIWTNVAFKQADFAAAHPDWFVTDEAGKPGRGSWVEFSLDASNAEAVDTVVRPVYRGLRDMGWEYFKVDALRHLRYEGYNAHAGYFGRTKRSLVRTYRGYVEAVRQEIGQDVFLLGCWGIRPELIGLIDGCRIGTDGFSYAGLAQFNSWNNVVWRNDPDHIELNEDRYKSTLVTSLTGSILLLTDKPELYRTEAAEPARRAAPVLWTVPGQVFDVDPSRSGELGRAGAEVSGSGSRVFDAGLQPTCDLFLLEVDRPFENWTVVGRTGGSVGELRFADLGLDPVKEYYVFEFWTKRLLGSFSGAFAPGSIDPVFRSQALAIRERRPHPQVIATSRHVTCGGVDLVEAHWEEGKLSGRSLVVAGDPYDIFLTEPEGFRLDKFDGPGVSVQEAKKNGILLKIRVLATESRTVDWTANFKAPSRP